MDIAIKTPQRSGDEHIESMKWLLLGCLVLNFILYFCLFHPVDSDPFLFHNIVILYVPIIHYLYSLNVSPRTVTGVALLTCWYLYHHLLAWIVVIPTYLTVLVCLYDLVLIGVYFLYMKHILLLYSLVIQFTVPLVRPSSDDIYIGSNSVVLYFLLSWYINDLFEFAGKNGLPIMDLLMIHLVLFHLPESLNVIYFVLTISLQIYFVMIAQPAAVEVELPSPSPLKIEPVPPPPSPPPSPLKIEPVPPPPSPPPLKIEPAPPPPPKPPRAAYTQIPTTYATIPRRSLPRQEKVEQPTMTNNTPPSSLAKAYLDHYKSSSSS